VTEKKKLIEVALPLEAINREASLQRSISGGRADLWLPVERFSSRLSSMTLLPIPNSFRPIPSKKRNGTGCLI